MPDTQREQAIKKLKAKQAVRYQALLFTAVTIGLVIVWAATGAGFFWPVFPMIGFLFALIPQAYNAYGRGGEITEDQINREMEKDRR